MTEPPGGLIEVEVSCLKDELMQGGNVCIKFSLLTGEVHFRQGCHRSNFNLQT